MFDPKTWQYNASGVGIYTNLEISLKSNKYKVYITYLEDFTTKKTVDKLEEE